MLIGFAHEGLKHLRRHRTCSEGQVSAGHALRHGHHVRDHTPVLRCEQSAGAAESRNHFVEDQQHAVMVTDFTKARQVPVRRDDHTAAADDRFGNDRRNR